MCACVSLLPADILSHDIYSHAHVTDMHTYSRRLVHSFVQVYRTAVNFRGQCYQRLIRFRQFYNFHKKLHLRDPSIARHIVFPSKEWTRNASLQEDVVEARQVLVRVCVLTSARTYRWSCISQCPFLFDVLRNS